MTNKRALELGSKFGLLYLILWVPVFFTQILLLVHPIHIAGVFSLIVGTIDGVLNLFLFYGLLKIAEERKEKKFIENIKITLGLIILQIILGDYLLLFGLRVKNNSPAFILVLVLSVILTEALGIIYLRLAKDYVALSNDYPKDAIKASKWSKLTGWLSVSIILSPIAIAASFFPDYYIWKIVRKRASKN